MAWELSLGGVGRGAGVGSRTVHTDITVNLFRAPGKVCYSKRWGDCPDPRASKWVSPCPCRMPPGGHQGLGQVAFVLCEFMGHLERPSPSRTQPSLSQEQSGLGCLYLSLLISVHLRARSVQSHEARAVDRLCVPQGTMPGDHGNRDCVCSVCSVCAQSREAEATETFSVCNGAGHQEAKAMVELDVCTMTPQGNPTLPSDRCLVSSVNCQPWGTGAPGSSLWGLQSWQPPSLLLASSVGLWLILKQLKRPQRSKSKQWRAGDG